MLSDGSPEYPGEPISIPRQTTLTIPEYQVQPYRTPYTVIITWQVK